MVAESLTTKTNDKRGLSARVVSPFAELRAYEALWAVDGMTESKLATLFDPVTLKRPTQVWQTFLNAQLSLFDDKYARLLDDVTSFLKKKLGRMSTVMHGDIQYPSTLRTAKYPVELLYYRGDLDLAKSKSISIVGARKASEDGTKRARSLARQLSEKGYTVVSGLAAGIDTAALKGAMDARGQVVGVIGTPIDVSYPRENASLQETIAEQFLLLSQVPMYRYQHEAFDNHRHYFPRRNVTMAALSEATVIVEASDTSGSLTQARACIAQGKRLFILDSCFRNPSIKWPATYLSKGAIRVRTIDDIVVGLA